MCVSVCVCVCLCVCVKYLSDFQHCEYEKVADGFGGVGFSLQDGDENDIRRVLESAVAATKEGKPSLINAWIGKSDFRDGSISM